jgi:hypothetical protein
MNNENLLHSLIPLEDFKTILTVDDREAALSRYCLVTATYSIEQYCKRRLFRGLHTDYLDFQGDRLLALREYPVRAIFTVYADRERRWGPATRLESRLYYRVPNPGTIEDFIYNLYILPEARLPHGERVIRVRYRAGYACGEAPADLGSACLELAAWNMTRYKGRRIGMTGAVRGKGNDGEHLEASMPEQVRGLLEPYVRRTI